MQQICSHSVEEAQAKLQLYHSQLLQHESEVHELQRSIEDGQRNLRSEVGEQVAACKEAVLSRVQLASHAIQACEMQAREQHERMTRQLDVGLEQVSQEANSKVEELEHKMASITTQQQELQRAVCDKTATCEQRVVAEVGKATEEIEQAITGCRMATEEQCSVMESFMLKSEQSRERLKQQLLDEFDKYRDHMKQEIVLVDERSTARVAQEAQARLELSQHVDEQLCSRQATENRLQHRVEEIAEELRRRNHELANEMRSQMDLCKQRIVQKVDIEAEWIQKEIQGCQEAVATQAKALQQLCATTGLQFSKTANAVRAASPPRTTGSPGSLSPVALPAA